MQKLPGGTVTFLFTDIEGSTRLAQQYPNSIGGLLERHHAILKDAIEAHGGYVFQIIGDAFCAAFQTVPEALDAAVQPQRRLAAESWSPEPIRVRMGISTGSAQVKLRDDRPPDYSGYLNLARVQRVMSVAYGGQILLGNASAELARGELPPNVSLRDMGEHRLKSQLNPERLWQVVAPGLQAEFPALKSLSAIPNNLPAQLTSFIGRQREMEEVKDLLQTRRLVSLTGAGGTGKSRLALQIAADVLDQFPNGIWFIELAPITDPALIPQTVVRVLGLAPDAGREPLEALKEYLADKCLLLIVDNCEHLLDDACRFADAILKAAPQVKIMPTSREALNLAGEQGYRVPSLSTPQPSHLPPVEQLTQYEAVHLFIERAVLAFPNFAVTNSNAPVVAQICHRLDGIPLAIELAAARVKSMPLDAIVSRLDDRFRLLTGGSRTSLPRQQTLRALIDWSYNLLSEPERWALQRLSVFRGGWMLEAAEAVCAGDGIEQGDVDDLLSKLVDKSLVSLDEHGRYRLLETVRQYAQEKLLDSGCGEQIRDRHLGYFLELAERAEPEIRGPNQLAWLDRLHAELDNLRTAMAWARERNTELFLRLASALWRFWEMRVYPEDPELLTNALALTSETMTVPRGMALARLAYIYSNYDRERTEQFARQALQVGKSLGDKQCIAMALPSLGWSLSKQDPVTAISLCNQALTLARELGEHWLAAATLGVLAQVRFEHNDLSSACSLWDQGLQASRLSGDKRLVAYSLGHLGFDHLARGDLEQAQHLLEEERSVCEEINDRSNAVGCHVDLGQAAIAGQDYQQAEESLKVAYERAKAMNARLLLGYVLVNFGLLDWARNDTLRLREHARAAQAFLEQADNPYFIAETLSLLGASHLIDRDYELANDDLTRALVMSREANSTAYFRCLQGLGCLALARGQAERAVRLLAARAKLRETTFAEDFYPFLVREREKVLAEARAQLGEEAFNNAWAEGQAMSEEEMLDYALQDVQG